MTGFPPDEIRAAGLRPACSQVRVQFHFPRGGSHWTVPFTGTVPLTSPPRGLSMVTARSSPSPSADTFHSSMKVFSN